MGAAFVTLLSFVLDSVRLVVVVLIALKIHQYLEARKKEENFGN